LPYDELMLEWKSVGLSNNTHKTDSEPTPEEICLECGGLCCKLGGIVATRNEVEAIVAEGFPDHFIQLANGVYGTEWGIDGTCPYFESGKCLIYSVRPTGCRMFPVVENSGTEIVLVECPLAPFLSEEELEERKSVLAQRPDNFIRASEQLRHEHLRELSMRISKYRHRKL
jgi:Fe-S-cluster containining protein